MTVGLLTEQERVHLAASVISAYKFVEKSPARFEKWQRSLSGVSSTEISALTGIEVEVVEAAVRNLGEKVTL